MPYKNTFLIHLRTIIAEIDKNNITTPDGALKKFEEYIKDLKTIGGYSSSSWADGLMDLMYEFGNRFKTTSIIAPAAFLEILEKEIILSTKEEKEILLFIKSEIVFFYETNDFLVSFINSLISEYPNNAEFRHDKGHLYLPQKNYTEAINNYNIAIKLHKKPSFIASKFQAEISFTDLMIENNELDKAQVFVDTIVKSEYYKHNFIQNNWLVLLQSRINDYKISEAKMAGIRESILKEVGKDGKKTVELLGIFTAIIVFIFSTITIERNFLFEQAIVLMICLGLILILFCVILSILFSDRSKPVLKDGRFYIIIALAVIVFATAAIAPAIAERIKCLLND
jgi:tetratricopeptide (TPR) repeat protein